MTLRNVLSADPTFRYCFNPSCSSGQYHEAAQEEPIFRCVECCAKFCLMHHPPAWHEDESCKKYDKQIQELQTNEADKEKQKAEMTLHRKQRSKKYHANARSAVLGSTRLKDAII